MCRPISPKRSLQRLFRHGSDLADGANAHIVSRFSPFAPTPQIRLTGNGVKNSVTLAAENHESVRLAEIAGELGEVLVRRDANGCDQAQSQSRMRS